MKSCTKTPGCIGPHAHTGDCATVRQAARLFADGAIEIAKAWARRMRKVRSAQS